MFTFWLFVDTFMQANLNKLFHKCLYWLCYFVGKLSTWRWLFITHTTLLSPCFTEVQLNWCVESVELPLISCLVSKFLQGVPKSLHSFLLTMYPLETWPCWWVAELTILGLFTNCTSCHLMSYFDYPPHQPHIYYFWKSWHNNMDPVFENVIFLCAFLVPVYLYYINIRTMLGFSLKFANPTNSVVICHLLADPDIGANLISN